MFPHCLGYVPRKDRRDCITYLSLGLTHPAVKIELIRERLQPRCLPKGNPSIQAVVPLDVAVVLSIFFTSSSVFIGDVCQVTKTEAIGVTEPIHCNLAES